MIYGLVRAGRCFFNIFCDKFEQLEADRRVFRKFDDEEVEMVVFMYVCMYGHTYSKSMDQPGKVANFARGQLNR